MNRPAPDAKPCPLSEKQLLALDLALNENKARRKSEQEYKRAFELQMHRQTPQTLGGVL